MRLSEIPFGRKLPALGGKALVERIPAFSRITNDAEEQDLPAAATSKTGEVWVAYMEFKHHPDHHKIRITPNRFDLLALKPGGDQVLVKKWSNGALERTDTGLATGWRSMAAGDCRRWTRAAVGVLVVQREWQFRDLRAVH